MADIFYDTCCDGCILAYFQTVTYRPDSTLCITLLHRER